MVHKSLLLRSLKKAKIPKRQEVNAIDMNNEVTYLYYISDETNSNEASAYGKEIL